MQMAGPHTLNLLVLFLSICLLLVFLRIVDGLALALVGRLGHLAVLSHVDVVGLGAW